MSVTYDAYPGEAREADVEVGGMTATCYACGAWLGSLLDRTVCVCKTCRQHRSTDRLVRTFAEAYDRRLQALTNSGDRR